MPRVDLQNPMVACEETIGWSDHSRNHDQDRAEVPPDIPTDSFRLSKDADIDSFENNSFYERKKSTKGNSGSTIMNPGPSSNSQRFSVVLKSQASIIGLPKTQKTCCMNARNPRSRKRENIRFFPKGAGHSGKSGATLIEPASPKVSCTGRVRSKRDRNRKVMNRRESVETANGKEKSVEKQRNGFFDRFRRIVQKGRRRRPVEDLPNTHASVEWPQRKSREKAAPGLGGVARFASGRRSDLWEI